MMPVSFYTLAGRIMHYGRYGAGGDDERLSPLFLGYPELVRGYDLGSVRAEECDAAGCEVFDRLVGSRVLVANAELRFPLLRPFGTGSRMYGPIRSTQDDRNRTRVRVAADRARRLETVETGHRNVHQDEVGLERLGLEDRVLAVVARHHLEAGLGQHIVQYVPFGRRIVDDRDLADGHVPTLLLHPCEFARQVGHA